MEAPCLNYCYRRRTRSRRLRKKLHIGEFQELGFDYELTWRAPPSVEVQDQFIDRLIEDVVEALALCLGGGVTCGFVAARRGNVTAADRAAFESWIRRWPGLDRVQVGPLREELAEAGTRTSEDPRFAEGLATVRPSLHRVYSDHCKH